MKSAMHHFPVSTYFASLGLFIMSWSTYEVNINRAIELIYQNWEGEQIDSFIPAISIKRKIKFLRKWYNNNPDFHKFYDWIPEQLDLLAECSDLRNTVIHGIMVVPPSQSITELNRASFMTYSPDRTRQDKKTMELKGNELDALSRIFYNAGKLWNVFGRLLEGSFYNPNDFFGEFSKQSTLLEFHLEIYTKLKN